MKRIVTILLGLGLAIGMICKWELEKKNQPAIYSENDFSEKKYYVGFSSPKKRNHPKQKNGNEKKSEENDQGKFDSPSQFVKILNELRTPDDASAPRYERNYRMTELRKAGIPLTSGSHGYKTFSTLAAPGSWIERGPANVAGRTRGLVVDPADPTHKTWLAGSVGGGVWKTADAGDSWTNLTPNIPNLAVSCLNMAPGNSAILYAGTGEGFFNIDAIAGDGIFKSIDHGESWTQIASTAANASFLTVNRLIVSQTGDTIIAATNDGLHRSVDGGQSWTKVFTSDPFTMQQVVANPLNFNTQYATNSDGLLFKSVNSGVSWKLISPAPFGYRTELAISPVDTNRIYASAEYDVLLMSQNGGSTWSVIRTPLPVNDPAVDSLNFLGGQGFYDNTIAAHPYDVNTLFVGGVDMFKVQVTPTLQGSFNTILSIDTVGTGGFMDFEHLNLTFFGGSLSTGNSIGNAPTTADPSDYVSIQIRFGPGHSQKAHRFTTESQGAGQLAFQYFYQDYVDVPFEVWDITNNQRLAVSFRDENGDGGFDLTNSTFGDGLCREYMFIHKIPYNSNAPDPNVAVTGGIKVKTIYEITPAPAENYTWDAANLPSATMTIIWGPIDFFRSVVTAISDPYDRYEGGVDNVHPDNHNIIIIPVNAPAQFKILNANDGGVAFSEDAGASWIKNQNTVRGYNSTQFYGVDKKPGASEYIGGAQDNGTWRSPSNGSPGSEWIRQLGGDGFDAVWNYKDPDQLIGSIYNNRLYKSTDGGNSFIDISQGIYLNAGEGSNSPFITRIGRSKLDPDLLFVPGRSGIWRSDNFGSTWTLSIPSQLKYGFSTSINHIEISKANPQVVWEGTRMSSNGDIDGNVHVSTDGGIVFKPVNNYTDVVLGRLSGLASHPTNPNEAFALFSFADKPKILRTMDLGQTWQDISGFGTSSSSSNGFPDVAVFSLLVMPHDTTEIWAGTEIGLFISHNNGATWTYSNNGLPAVSIWQMDIVDQEVVVATHGRGVWSIQLPQIPPLPKVTLSPRLNAAGQTPAGGMLLVSASLRSPYDSTVVIINNAAILQLGATTVQDTLLYIPTTKIGSVKVELASFKSGSVYRSAAQNVKLAPAAAARSVYANDFNSDNGDFISEGLFIRSASGFQNGAIHSLHPYADNTTAIIKLNIPVIVSTDTTKRMTFDEIVLVEPGEEGSVFGDDDFWDYCIVEGTSDGITWKPLLPGYDARDQAKWLEAYNKKTNGSPLLFQKRTIDLKRTFTPGTPVFIRFRLYADANTNGWGWAIDNIKINTDNAAPQLTLAALASPVIEHYVRFGVGGNEPLAEASFSINDQPASALKQGSLYFTDYELNGANELRVWATAKDTSSNSGYISRNYHVTPLSKPALFMNYTAKSIETNGYFLAAEADEFPGASGWKLIGRPVDIISTNKNGTFEIEASYETGEALSGTEKTDESQIGFYQWSGKWQYIGGQGDHGKVMTKTGGGIIAVFLNPDHESLPKSFALKQNYPNPFNPVTTIEYDVPRQSKISIKVYNMLGQEVRTLVSETKQAGRHRVQWDGKNNAGASVASGMYVYRLQAEKFTTAKKLLLIK